MRFLYSVSLLTVLILSSCFFFACRKNTVSTNNSDTLQNSRPNDTTATNNDTTANNVDTGSYASNNKWQCQIDGVTYSGTVDTSFFKISNPERYYPDTVVDCNGTSFDKKANIHLRIIINRTSNPGPISTSFYDGLLVFDTISSRALVASSNYRQSNVLFNIDSLKDNKLKVNFSGTLEWPVDSHLQGGGTRTITNGTLSCEFGKGDSEPKSFSFTAAGSNIAGYVNAASFNLNSLLLEGLPYSYFGEQSFNLLIHTGASIKPGVYKSSRGQVGMSFYIPSIFPYFISDSLGDLSVTISSVEGNIIKGSFSGTNYSGAVISNGKFACRVKNYQPYEDSANKWKWSDQNITYGTQIICGGNILNAVKRNSRNQYFLTINGESNNLTSAFKLVISSYGPIDTGKYIASIIARGPLIKTLDTLYFITGDGIKYFNNESSKNYYCYIDTINGSKVVGRIGLAPPGSQIIKTGRFNATFH